MTAAKRIAEALREHNNAWNWGSGWQCDCGAAVSVTSGGISKHQAEVIVGLPGMAVVELPEVLHTSYRRDSDGPLLDSAACVEMAGELLLQARAVGGAS
ncbi:hypothetical protein [Rhodococcus sp. MEB041]|uniref:hypothetical protein n=1 Tax=Rhodococcus sp. MEB041 TaxID=3040323 RepID=UPI00254E0718|nr:hypothetical protein [Rhodococcus sp. MEB041]